MAFEPNSRGPYWSFYIGPCFLVGVWPRADKCCLNLVDLNLLLSRGQGPVGVYSSVIELNLLFKLQPWASRCLFEILSNLTFR